MDKFWLGCIVGTFATCLIEVVAVLILVQVLSWQRAKKLSALNPIWVEGMREFSRSLSKSRLGEPPSGFSS